MTRSDRYTSILMYLVTIIVVGLYYRYDVSATTAAGATTSATWWGKNHGETKLVTTTTKTSMRRSESPTKKCDFFVSRFCRGGGGDDDDDDDNDNDNNDNADTNNNSDLTDESITAETVAVVEETTATDSEAVSEASSSDDTDVDVNIDKEISIEESDTETTRAGGELPSSTTTGSVTSTSSSSSVNLISTSDSRLPMSITTVVADLEAEGYNELSTACLIVSKSVSNKQRQILLNSLSSSSSSSSSSTTDTSTSTTSFDKVFGYSNGLIITNPLSINEVSACTVVCNGTILYYANDIDIERNEGLFISLAPAIETIVKTIKSSSSTITPTLYIVGNEQLIRSKIEKSAASYLSSMVHENQQHQSSLSSSMTKIRTLNDVFSKIIYIPSIQNVVSTIVTDSKQSLTTTTPEIVSSTVATVVASSTSTDYSTTTASSTKKQTNDNDAINLAAARILGPPARIQLRRTIDIIQNACQSSSTSSTSSSSLDQTETILVPEFGALCTAAVNTAIADLTMTQSSSSTGSSNNIKSALHNSDIGKQIKQNFLVEIDSQLTDIVEQQLNILQTTLFEQCKKQLSKLLISPNLQNDMYTVLQGSIKSFTQIGTKLISTQYISNGSSMLSAYTVAYSRQLVTYITNRLLSARVSGQYKPLPKKGITIGLHWLLPKPFGNDYRQEPWMVHSTDNMVYIPSSKKLSDVDPNTDIRTGDWRTKIIPNPAGNDMLYMQ